MELELVKLKEVAEEVGWRHAEAPLNMTLEHQYLSLYWSGH
jgi:hypothetical protein